MKARLDLLAPNVSQLRTRKRGATAGGPGQLHPWAAGKLPFLLFVCSMCSVCSGCAFVRMIQAQANKCFFNLYLWFLWSDLISDINSSCCKLFPFPYSRSWLLPWLYNWTHSCNRTAALWMEAILVEGCKGPAIMAVGVGRECCRRLARSRLVTLCSAFPPSHPLMTEVKWKTDSVL